MPDPPKIETLPRKTALTVLLVIVLLVVLPQIPGLQQFAGLRPEHFAEMAKVPEAKSSITSSAPGAGVASNQPRQPGSKPHTRPGQNPATGQLDTPEQTQLAIVSPYLIDPQGALHHFYEALGRTAMKDPGAVTLVLHYGDSPVTADSITADARSILQSRFGDAGHGYLLIAKPWAWYGHRGVDLRAKGWNMQAASQGNRARDGIHGLGGVSFVGSQGASSRVQFPDSQHRDVEIDYLAQPSGGNFVVKAGDHSLGDVQTEGPEKKPAFAHFSLPAGADGLELTVTSGTVRLFGYSFAKPGPGLVYSSLGLNGAQVQAVLRYFEVNQWTEQLRHQHPDLVVVNYGTNEAEFPAYIEKQYPSELRQVIQRIQAALPGTSILIMSPMDRGHRDSSGEIVTPAVLPRIVELQKQIALELGCAFFNTFEAMGGAGTMARWYNAQPRLVSADFTHPLPAGAAKVGTLLDEALIQSFDRYESDQRRQLAQKQTKP